MKAWLISLTLFCTFSLYSQITPNPCVRQSVFKVVVIGSSTAAGAGASQADSAWVSRYRRALKSINAQNEVINLAQGGYTTYRLMPNNYSTTFPRPAVDTLKNITAALKQNPSAVIVNLPSNDRQWPMSEQLSNFDSIVNYAGAQGVPVFVCTTQPIAPLNVATYQKAVRDSIMAKFGLFAIDVFTALADTNNTVNPLYAADAVHLNDLGHAILFNLVLQADVLTKSFKQKPSTDLAWQELIKPNNQCADSLQSLGLVLSNLGDTAYAGAFGYLKSTGIINDSLGLNLSQNLAPCQQDTVWVNLNMGSAGAYLVEAFIASTADTFYSNNYRADSFHLVENPQINFTNDSLCPGYMASFALNSFLADTIFWYENPTDTLPISTGANFNLQKDTSLFVQAVNGPLTYSNSLTTLEQANINFKGNMFDLAVKQNINLQALGVRIHGSGLTLINLYVKTGSYRGFENQASLWTLLYNTTVLVNNSGDFVRLNITDTALFAGDTVGFYVQVTSGPNQVMYQSNSAPVTYSNSQISFNSGAGIAQNFGTAYPNRSLNVKFYYEYGFNRLGLCASPLLEVKRLVSKYSINLGPNQFFNGSSLTLSVSAAYSQVVWSNLATADTLGQGNSLVVDTSIFKNNLDSLVLGASGLNARGCYTADTLTLYKGSLKIGGNASQRLALFPNPSQGVVYLKAPLGCLLQVYSSSGRLVFKKRVVAKQEKLDLGHLAKGIYLVKLYNKDFIHLQKLLLE